jgi:serine/threonine-protein kinase
MFDNYELLRELGKGAFGTVYLAKQRALDRDVAIKILLPEASHDQGFIVRFQREAKMAASLRHPNIVQVFNASQVADQYYIAMEYIDGQNLREMLDNGYAPDWKEAIDLIIQLLCALQHAHGKDIIHRDIKPANILVEKPHRVVLTDFSIAHMKDASRLTTTGHYLGTPEYIAPEILDAVPVSPATDLYAVGLILYELVTGVHPFRGNSIPQVIKAQLFNVPRSPDELNPQLPRAVARVINLALLKDCRKRPQSAAEMTRMLVEARDSKVPVVSLGPVPAAALPERPPAAAAPRVRLDAWPEAAATLPVEKPLVSLAKASPPAPAPAAPAPAPAPAAPAPPPPSHLPPASPPPPTPSAEAWPKPDIDRALKGEPGARPPRPSRFWDRCLRAVLVLALLVAGAFAWEQVSVGQPVASPHQGRLVLQADPPSLDISLNGRPKLPHKNGDRLQLSPGHYTLVGSRPGYRNKQASLQVRSDQVSRVVFRLEPQGASLRVTYQPAGIQVAIDGGESQPLGESPCTLPLEVGLHRFSFRKEHYLSQELTRTLRDQELLECSLVLQPKPARLDVQSKPTGCTLWVNGKEVGVTPFVAPIAAGRLKLKLTHPGYKDEVWWAQLEPDQTFLKVVSLKRIPPRPKAPSPPVSQPEYFPPPAYQSPPPYYPPPPPRSGGPLNDWR